MVFYFSFIFYTTELAFDAILGNSSAHSLAIGPVIADPFISPFGFKMTPALSSKTPNSHYPSILNSICYLLLIKKYRIR